MDITIQKMIERLRSVPSYVGLGHIERSIDSKYPINTKDLESVAGVFQESTEKFDPIGIFNIGTVHLVGDETRKDPKLISHVTIGRIDREGEDEKEDMYLLLQIDDLPLEMAHEVRTVEDVEEFLQVYNLNRCGDSEPTDNDCDNDSMSSDSEGFDQETPAITTVSFDLRRNSEYRPIMMERYMMLSRFTQPYPYGPYCNPNIIELYMITNNSFNLAVQYFDVMRQNEDSFAISVRTRYSNSLIKIRFNFAGVIAEVEYPPIQSCRLVKFIDSFNEKTDADLPTDLPIDVFLFLSPMRPWRSRRVYNEVMEKDTPPNSRIVSVLDMIYDKEQFEDLKSDDPYYEIMKSLYRLCDNKNVKNDNESKHNEEMKITREMIRVNITGDYIQDFKNSFKPDDSKDVMDALRQIENAMEKDDNHTFMSREYVLYALSNFFELFDDEQDNSENNSDNDSDE